MNDKKLMNALMVMVTLFVTIPAVSFLLGYILYLVWNNILVDVVSVVLPITYWKAFFLTFSVVFVRGIAILGKQISDDE